jgi:hypothetical protein
MYMFRMRKTPSHVTQRNNAPIINKIIEICNKYNIKPEFNNTPSYHTGIGDILFRFLSIKNKLFNDVFYINLNYFTTRYHGMEPINQLEFRIKLIMDICRYNDIPLHQIKFTFTNILDIEQRIRYNEITDFNLKLCTTENNTENNTNDKEYIIFHTKCRHTQEEDYDNLKQKIKLFCKNNKCHYKIIIMGERVMPYTDEVGFHGITTVYNELIELKDVNDVEDITIENIYSNLDYENYKKDIEIIKNAKYNICFGIGGQFCSCVCFGKSTIVYCKIDNQLNTQAFNKNNFYCNNIDSCLKKLQDLCFECESIPN